MNYLQAIIVAIVEGITEFLPVSSTGHMIITTSVMGIVSQDFTKLFTIAIQLGAIIAVLFLYRQKFINGLKDWSFYFKLLLAFIPAAVIGFLLNDFIDQMLESVIIVSYSLIIGGVILIYIDSFFKNNTLETYTYQNSFLIGCFQLIALIPGVSRSAATIVGGLSQKLTKKTASEFSFFLAVPTMLAATGYKLLKYLKTHEITSKEISLLLVGNVVAFVVAIIAIKSFINYVSNKGFLIFGIYRIALGLILLILLYFQVPLQLV